MPFCCSYSEELGKWMELGNSGVFRPEMLRPMGLPEDVNVIAWGLSLERCTSCVSCHAIPLLFQCRCISQALHTCT